MRVEDAARVAAEIRATVPPGASVAAPVAEIIDAVRARGDAALAEYERRFGAGTEPPFRVSGGAVSDDVRAGLEVAIANVRAVATAGLDEERGALLPQGHSVTLREVPVRRAAVYAPSGRNPYPSTVVMGAVTARVAGVDEVFVVASPHPAILAAAEMCEVDDVFGITGAQSIAALAYGTESIPRVDVIVGPGSLWVQEAKRQVSHVVGIDGFAGPSDLTVIASEGADVEALALDLDAQAEHGEGSLTVAVSDRQEILDGLRASAKVLADDMEAALAFAEALAPEHLQLAGEAAEALAPRVRSAGCLFVGNAAGTAFGDYVAGSNHTLPTEGAARFASGLNVRHFRRRMAEVRLDGAAPALATAGIPIAHAEGFPAHAASMAVRQNRQQ
ncbi:MAG TPA: histidinol dehydrogenase [Solirubrobacter sp.]|nr:histidinol dehydrogenase [Solirubrobacter sp.]